MHAITHDSSCQHALSAAFTSPYARQHSLSQLHPNNVSLAAAQARADCVLLLLQDVFQVEFVVMADRSTGAAVDNNRQQNFQLPLAGALTEDQIHARRAQRVAAFERENLQVRFLHHAW